MFNQSKYNEIINQKESFLIYFNGELQHKINQFFERYLNNNESNIIKFNKKKYLFPFTYKYFSYDEDYNISVDDSLSSLFSQKGMILILNFLFTFM